MQKYWVLQILDIEKKMNIFKDISKANIKSDKNPHPVSEKWWNTQLTSGPTGRGRKLHPQVRATSHFQSESALAQ